MIALMDWVVGNALATAILALVVGVLARFLRRRPALVHVLWLIVLLKPLTPPMIEIGLLPSSNSAPLADAAPAQEATNTSLEVAPIESDVWERLLDDPEVLAALFAAEDRVAKTELAPTPPAIHSERSMPFWFLIVASIMALGTMTVAACTIVRMHRFKRLLDAALPAPRAVRRRLDVLARRIGLERHPAAWVVPATISPMLWGWRRGGKLLLPAALLDRLDAESLDTLLLHELAHFARNDHWVRIVEVAANVIAWWHPAVWFARRNLRRAEEECCDAWVVTTMPGRGRAYATALLECLDFLAGVEVSAPPAASGLSPVAELKRRVEMIMSARTPNRLSWTARCALIAAAATLLPLLPTRAQDTNPIGGQPGVSGAFSGSVAHSFGPSTGGISGAAAGGMGVSTTSADPFVASAAGQGGGSGMGVDVPGFQGGLSGAAGTMSTSQATCDDLEEAIAELKLMADEAASRGRKDDAERLVRICHRLESVRKARAGQNVAKDPMDRYREKAMDQLVEVQRRYKAARADEEVRARDVRELEVQRKRQADIEEHKRALEMHQQALKKRLVDAEGQAHHEVLVERLRALADLDSERAKLEHERAQLQAEKAERFEVMMRDARAAAQAEQEKAAEGRWIPLKARLDRTAEAKAQFDALNARSQAEAAAEQEALARKHVELQVQLDALKMELEKLLIEKKIAVRIQEEGKKPVDIQQRKQIEIQMDPRSKRRDL